MKPKNKDSQFPRFFVAPEGIKWALTLCLVFHGETSVTSIMCDGKLANYSETNLASIMRNGKRVKHDKKFNCSDTLTLSNCEKKI